MNTIREILFVINPKAGNTDKEELLGFVEQFIKSQDIRLVTYKTVGKYDDHAITVLIKQHSFDRIFVAGGDGTIQMMAGILMDYNIPLGIFPEGSANGLALNLNIPNTTEEQLKVALSENIINLDVLRMNDDICIHIADFGVNAELIKNFEEGSIRGKIGYALKSIPTLLNTDYPFTFEIKANGMTQTKEGAVLAIANAMKYGTGATVNPDGKMDDGFFEIIIFKNLNIIDIIKTLTENNNLDPDFAEVISTNNAEIICKSPVPFQVDGEYMGEITKLDITVLKKKIAVAVPESA
tara:strand:- start:58708 stop:59592 length:885 start_codon:yes stop_codon:yes gene_type:complete